MNVGVLSGGLQGQVPHRDWGQASVHISSPIHTYFLSPADTNAEFEPRSQSPVYKHLWRPQEDHTNGRLLEAPAGPECDDNGRRARTCHVFCLLRKHEKDFK